MILAFPNEVSIEFLINEFEKALTKISLEDFKGSLIIIEPERIRIRH